jgi:hypothetical protein
LAGFGEGGQLRLGQLAFARDPLVLFGGAFDPIFELTAIVGQLLFHLVDTARHIPLLQCDVLSKAKFMGHGGYPLVIRVLNPPVRSRRSAAGPIDSVYSKKLCCIPLGLPGLGRRISLVHR